MEGSVRSGGIVKKKSSSGCLIIKKKDGGGGVGLGSSGGVKKRPRLVPSDSESSEELLEPIRRRGGEKFHNERVGSVKSGGESREFGGNGKFESVERKRSKLDLFDFDEYDEFDEEKKWNVARTTGSSSREFASGGSSRNMMVEKRKHSNIDSSSSLSGSRAKGGDEYGVNKMYDLDDDEAHMPISLLRLKYQESPQEPIRLQGKNGVLKVMVNKKKKKIDLPHKDYNLESKKGSRSENVVKKDLLGRASFHSDSKRPEKHPLSIKTELKSQKPSLAKGVKSVDDEIDVTDTLLKLAPPNSQPVTSKTTEIKEESRSLAAEDVTPAKSKEGKLKSMEKQQLQPASSKTRVIKDESRAVEAEDVTPAKSKEGKLKRGGSTEKQQLREKIRGMLIESGWTIDYRPRRNRDYLDAVYINPSGTAYWSIIKAYDALQKQSGEDSGKSKLDGGSSSFAPLADDLINKLTRRTRKKIEKEMKRKRKDDAKNRDYKESTLGESEEDTDGEQHEERLSSYVKKKSKLLKGKSHATDHESDGDTSGNSLKGERLKQDMSGKSSVGAASSAMQGRKSRILGRCTLLVRRSDKEQDSESDGYVAYTGKRTLLAWMIDSGTVKLSQKVQYMNRRRTRVKLEGWITRDGIHCGCCSKILPVSKFELHAGSTLRQPFQNIIVESGVSLLECLVDTWNRQEESERQDFHTVKVDPDDPDDDTCGICGDGGDLICCDGCPSTFHQSCLGIQMLPQGDWHCPNCTCKFCGTASTTAEDGEGAVDGLLNCSLCEKKYHKSCSLDINALPASSSNPSVSFCGRKCQELYDHLQKILGVKHEIEAGFTWSLIQRTDLDSDRSHHAFPQRVECNSKLAVALAVMDECFLPIVDRKSGINIIHNVLYNCGSNYSRLNFRGFYTAILERGDEIISAASIRIHGTQLAEMPYIGTRNIYRRQGMCRRLLSAIETVLSTLEVEKLIIPAISEHMHTWTVVFGFNPLEESEKLKMKSINMLVFPGTDMLQKRLLNGEIPEAGINDGDSKHSNPRLPDLVERADQESLTQFDGNLHDEACGEKVDDGVDAMHSDSPATAIDLHDSAVDRAQSVYRDSDIKISSKEARSFQSNVEKKLAGSTTKLMPSSASGASIGNTDSGDAAVNDPSTEVDAQSSEPVHQDLCKENAQATCSIIDIDMSDEASARNMNSEKQDEEVPNTTSTDAIEKDFSAETTKLVPSSPSGSSIGNTDSGNAALGPSTEVDARSSEPVHQNLCKENAQKTCSVFGIDLSDEASTRNMKSEKQDEEVPNTTSTDASGKDFSADTTKLVPSSHSGANIGNTDSGDAALGPFTEVDAQSSEPVHKNICKENSQTTCSVFSIDSSREASAGNMEAKKQDEEVPNTTSTDANGKDFSADTTNLMPSYPSGASIGNTNSGDTALGLSTEVDAQSSEPVHPNSQTTCSVFDIDSSDEASARNMEAKKQNEVSNTASTAANVQDFSADTTDSFLEPAGQSAVEGDKKEVSECVSATYASAKPAISLNADSTRSSRPDVQNGLLHMALKKTSDIECLGDANVSLEEGNLDDPAIGGGVNDDNGAEVPSNRPAKDSSSEPSLNAAPEKNSDYRLDSSPRSQACSSGLKPSDGSSAAKFTLSEKIVHSEPSQAESREVTVMDRCSGTVHSSADDSAQHAAEEKIQT